MWRLWAVLGCGHGSGDSGNAPDEFGLELDPTKVDFGVVEFGQSSAQVLTLHNSGADDLYVTELLTSSPSLQVTGTGMIRAGASAEIPVDWTPSDVADLYGWLHFRVGTSLESLSDRKVPVVGTVSGADLTVSHESYDMGIVKVGCSGVVPLELKNGGTAPLDVASLELTNDSEFTLVDGVTGAGPVLPMHLRAGEAAAIDLVYTPTSEHSANTTVEIASNDAIAPTTTMRVDGEGIIEATNSMSWTVESEQAVTAILNVNELLDKAGFGDRLRDFVPALFDALLAAEMSFRVAIVMHEDGHVAGDVPYIDDSFDSDDAVDAAEAMLAGPSVFNDNDTNLETLLNALDRNEDWLIDDGDLWRQSRLNLVAINSDIEQSPGDAAYYVNLYDDYKDRSEYAVHAIAGAPPAGCGGIGETHGEPAQNLYDAAMTTGGAFVSICDEDWTKTASTLVSAFRGDLETFVLDGNPVSQSIEVRIDGDRVLTGWSYDAKTNSVMFDNATYPARGAELRVDYVIAPTCD